MELRVEARLGVALAVSTVAQPLLRTATKETTLVEVWVGYDDENPNLAQMLGVVPPGGTLVREWNPDRDRNLRLYQRRLTDDGIPDVGQLLDAESVALPINRMVDTPTLVQPSNATHTKVYLAVPPNRYATQIRFRVSPNADMSGATETEVDAGNDLQGTVFEITRGTLGAGVQTRYVTVAYNAGSGYGPESAITTITFADIGGSGGSGGTSLPPGALQPVTVS